MNETTENTTQEKPIYPFSDEDRDLSLYIRQKKRESIDYDIELKRLELETRKQEIQDKANDSKMERILNKILLISQVKAISPELEELSDDGMIQGDDIKNIKDLIHELKGGSTLQTNNTQQQQSTPHTKDLDPVAVEVNYSDKEIENMINTAPPYAKAILKSMTDEQIESQMIGQLSTPQGGGKGKPDKDSIQRGIKAIREW